MEFLTKHYEKIILSVVLVGLSAAVVYMLMRIDAEKAYLEEKRKGIEARKNPYRQLNTSIYDSALERTKKFHPVVLAGPHNTFNPVLWQMKPDGTLIKVVTGTEVGPAAAVVTSITNLYFILSLEGVSGSSYHVGITRQTGKTKAEKEMRKRYVSMNSPKNEFFTLKEVKGAPEKPDELVVELTDTKELVGFSKDKPYKRTDAYTADIRYDIENLKFNNLRHGDTIAFAGDEYVVEIKADEVVLSAKSSTKRTTLTIK